MDNDSQLQVTREELYARVWNEPMRTVAKSIGVSDVPLAKRCRRMAKRITEGPHELAEHFVESPYEPKCFGPARIREHIEEP